MPQQTPSTQLPVLHWLAAVHAAPAASLDVHEPALQKYAVLRQSVSDVQVVLQATDAQAYAPHEVVGWLQVPEPLQVPGSVWVLAVQLPVPQAIDEPG